jgi:predicted LPLAT superfamily acyltransferase
MPEQPPGFTLAMVQALPATGAAVVVHNANMRDYLERMIEATRGAAVRQATRILVINSTYDADRLRGWRGTIHIDHAWFSYTPREVCNYVLQLAAGCAARHAPPEALDA